MTQRGGKRKPTPPSTAANPKKARRGRAGTSSSPVGTGVGNKRKQLTPEEAVEDDDGADGVELVETEDSTLWASVLAWGATCMLFRILITIAETGRSIWHRCSGKERGHDHDSFVYRYEREVGFMRADAAEEASIVHDFARRALLCQPLVCFGCSAAGTQAGLCVSLSPHSHIPCADRSNYDIGDFLSGQRLPSEPRCALSASRARRLRVVGPNGRVGTCITARGNDCIALVTRAMCCVPRLHVGQCMGAIIPVPRPR